MTCGDRPRRVAAADSSPCPGTGAPRIRIAIWVTSTLAVVSLLVGAGVAVAVTVRHRLDAAGAARQTHERPPCRARGKWASTTRWTG